MIADLMDKIGRNVPLTSIELHELRNEFRSMDEVKNLVKGWVQAGTSNPIFVPPMQVIYSKVLDADTASLTINIPSVYKHLLIMGQGRINGSGGQVSVYLHAQFNGDAGGTNYQYGLLFHAGTTVAANYSTGLNHVLFGVFAADGAGSGFAGASFLSIPHYQSSYYKTSLMIDGTSYASNVTTAIWQGVWKDTSPIRSITIFPDATYPSAKMESGSLFSIYGIL